MQGNPFFTQERPGKDEKIFKLVKFRTMSNAKDKDGNLLPDDIRLNKYGRILRSTSLDELPELWNILKGDMSIVGPRPHMLKHTDEFTEMVDGYMLRHQVKPGVTGWSQVNGYRGEIKKVEDIQNRVKFDLWYIDNWSFFLDIRIILKTMALCFGNDRHAL
jgi:putative colanic acid biosynthesis UDP-glucose lipid carrier transferase